MEDCTTRTFEMTCRAGDAWGCTMYGAALIKRGERGAQVRGALEAACANTNERDPACVAARQLLEKFR